MSKFRIHNVDYTEGVKMRSMRSPWQLKLGSRSFGYYATYEKALKAFRKQTWA